MGNYTNVLKKFWNQIHPLNKEEELAFLTAWKEVHFKRKEIITQAGGIERYVYFVVKGVQHAYFLKDGKAHTTAFTYAPSFSGVVDSFLAQRPAKVSLECITDSVLLRIPHYKVQELVEKHRGIETFFRKGTEGLLIGLMERHYELLALDIEERFRVFVQRSPHLLNMIPQKYLASYLNIHPTNFSKLMGRIKI
ncbi:MULTISPECIES: Crp/Fnr family transcriptional regulator [unclassified Aureispira]|uniref:Crp/Fnr family transcriptional regulator n=1 Tax=unclassified Aureispira TaxID=2649989 RepID=UPI000698F3C8|nr:MULTISPECIES: cyclic nucleotide-binding domain-containing protein [unclassified Aureispira]WMX16163.1 cyclic nucleotide-binding domain-containing protein [Aureispira sp. CCB-E]